MAATRSNANKKSTGRSTATSGAKANGKAGGGKSSRSRTTAAKTGGGTKSATKSGGAKASGKAAGARKTASGAADKTKAESNGIASKLPIPSSGEVGDLLKKAKTPAAVAGAALVGAAGGMAMARNGRKGWSPKSMVSSSGLKKGISGIDLHLPGRSSGPVSSIKKGLKNIDLPKPDSSMMDWVEDKARTVGKRGYQVAELSAQARDLQKKLSD